MSHPGTGGSRLCLIAQLGAAGVGFGVVSTPTTLTSGGCCRGGSGPRGLGDLSSPLFNLYPQKMGLSSRTGRVWPLWNAGNASTP